MITICVVTSKSKKVKNELSKRIIYQYIAKILCLIFTAKTSY